MENINSMIDIRGQIIDAHCHVASTHFIPRGFFEGIARNLHAKAVATGQQALSLEAILTFLVSRHQDHDADQLVEEMDEAGIARSILLVPDFTYSFDHSLDIEKIVELHANIMERHKGRFYLFTGVDPRSDNAVERFRGLVNKYKIAGLKIYPPCGYSPSIESLFPFYEICGEHGLPVLLHTGPTSPTLDFKYSHPGLIDTAAKEFPRVNFILGHGGINHTEDCVLLCAYRDNVFLDFSAFTSTCNPKGWRAQLSELFRAGINHKIIFGTDWPVAKESGGLRSTLSQLLDTNGPFNGLCNQDREQILSRNILRILPEGLRDIGAV